MAIKSRNVNSLRKGVLPVTGCPEKGNDADEIACAKAVLRVSILRPFAVVERPAQATCEAQNAHLRAATGISLRHSGHGFLSGAPGGSSLCIRAISAFTGSTTK